MGLLIRQYEMQWQIKVEEEWYVDGIHSAIELCRYLMELDMKFTVFPNSAESTETKVMKVRIEAVLSYKYAEQMLQMVKKLVTYKEIYGHKPTATSLPPLPKMENEDERIEKCF